jgi:hypothetical protein
MSGSDTDRESGTLLPLENLMLKQQLPTNQQ